MRLTTLVSEPFREKLKISQRRKYSEEDLAKADQNRLYILHPNLDRTIQIQTRRQISIYNKKLAAHSDLINTSLPPE